MKHEMHCQTPFWKLALGGVLTGAALYFFPFLLPALAFLLLAGVMFRMFFGFGRWGGPPMQMRHAYFAKLQSMTDEQRQAMREKFRGRCCGPWEHPVESTPPSTTPNA